MSGKEEKPKSVRIRPETFERLTKLKAPRQIYDGFIGQLLDLWEEKSLKEEKKKGPAGGNQCAEVSHPSA
jgi:hypothetical protein